MYKGKPLIAHKRPWWRHPIFPWGWYSLKQDRIPFDKPVTVDGYYAAGDGGGGIFRYVPERPDARPRRD